jgi:peptidoglycan hydrolase CwlO-like protein
MVSLEQVKLLETKIAKAIDYVERVTGENALLQGKLESYQKRIDELEVLVRQFKEDQGRIEDGILSALDKLNQFEDAISKSLSAPEAKKAEPAASKQAASKTSEKPLSAGKVPAEKPAAGKIVPDNAGTEDPDSADDLFDDQADDLSLDIKDPLAGGAGNGELDIF